MVREGGLREARERVGVCVGRAAPPGRGSPGDRRRRQQRRWHWGGRAGASPGRAAAAHSPAPLAAPVQRQPGRQRGRRSRWDKL